MRILTKNSHFHIVEPTAIAIGKFDGLHLGHQKLLAQILACKEQGLASCVFTFTPSPAVFFGWQDDLELMTTAEKRDYFERLGVDYVVEFPLTKESASMDPSDFVRQVLTEQLHLQFLAAGEDVSFGKGGLGNAALLRKLSTELGFTLRLIEKVAYRDQIISSSYVRRAVLGGDLTLATVLLGTPYEIIGEIDADGLMRNVPPTKLLPPPGDYLGMLYSLDNQPLTDQIVIHIYSYIQHPCCNLELPGSICDFPPNVRLVLLRRL
ncbi:MAG: bifunctional riboflavin kinase/FMN adenylyltransferase [Clostridium sp.]|nr:bifunctional riboflavin kinase/FMN adenylyltransferase [Clostridium sp.]